MHAKGYKGDAVLAIQFIRAGILSLTSPTRWSTSVIKLSAYIVKGLKKGQVLVSQ